MTLTQTNRVRIPGPTGLLPSTGSGRIPGPLGIGGTIVVAQSSVTKVAPKVLAMPPPSHSSTQMLALKVDWPLFLNEPSPADVTQGELATCPIASILAAMAATAWGRRRIHEITGVPNSATVNTTLSDEIIKQLKKHLEEPDLKQPNKNVASDRYFAIKISDPPIEVSDVLYVRYTEGTNGDPVYMQSIPQDEKKGRRVLWPAVIEKAYAQKIGSYQDLDDYGPSGTPVDAYWTVLIGSKPHKIVVNKGAEAKIKAVATAASRNPAIAATKEEVKTLEDRHGYAITGMQGNRIQLYDPWGSPVTVTIAQFIEDVEQVLVKP